MKLLSRFFVLYLFCLSYTLAQNTLSLQTIGNLWHPVNNPAYPILNNLYFLSTTEGWIVGDLGKVLHTVDGGDHWIDVPAGINTTLRAVFFSDETTGYIGGDGNILRTRDGGFSWTKTTTDFDIYDIYFDPVLKNKGYAVGSKGIILSTNDYGNTWYSTTSGNQNLNRIAFNLPNKGWITGSVFTTGSGSWANYNDSTTLPIIEGSISFTDNSGLTWASVSSGYTLTDIQFINPNIGFIPENQVISYHLDSVQTHGGYGELIYGYFNFTYDINHYLFKTNNGWNTYSFSTIFSEHSVNTVRSIYISFPTFITGYAIGENLDKIYKTTDGGNTWTSLTTGYNSLLIRRISFKTPNDGWLVGTQVSTDLGIGIILATHDGGQSWQKQSPNSGFSPYAPLESISFGVDNVGWMAGAGGQPAQYKFYENDQYWHLISTLDNDGNDLLALNQNTAYIADSQLSITTNGGQSWNNLSYYITNLWYANTTTFWEGGYYIDYGLHGSYVVVPAIYRSVDMGSTHVTYYGNFTPGFEISSIYFINETTGWAILHYRYRENYSYTTVQYLVYTRDGGSTWNQQNLPQIDPKMTYQHIFFSTPCSGWICDEYGRLLNTLDSGTNWNVWQASTNSLNKICFISPLIGWIIGDNGTILQTRDGGNSWQYLDKITSENLNDITFTPDGTGYIVGDNGTLLRLDPGAVSSTAITLKVWESFN